MNIHLKGLKNIDNPGILLLKNLLICLHCGISQFTISKTELALLSKKHSNE
jgi:hypothetical protein